MPIPHAAILVLLLGWVAASHAADLRPLSSVADVAKTGAADVGRPARFRALVTYCDPSGRCLFVQDADRGLFVRIPADNMILSPGQWAEVRGVLADPGIVDAVEARAVGADLPPVPVAVDADRFAAGAEPNRRVALRGVV